MKMQMFSDEELTIPIDSISFGRVNIGTSKEITVYILNESINNIDKLKFIPQNKEVTVSYAPRRIGKKDSAPVKLVWTPSLKIKKGLNVEVRVEGVMVYE